MTVVHYMAEVRPGLLLALPEEARQLPLHPGDKIEVQLDMPIPQAPEIEESKLVDPKAAASILLPDLEPLGYRGLAMEIPCELSTPIVDWIQGRTTDPTFFFEPRTIGDGRESVQAVSLFRQMLQRETGWNLICFDSGSHQPNGNWEDRDAQMAGNLEEQWRQLCPTHKIIAVCGNFHSRLTPGVVAPPECWPAFAAKFVQEAPERKVISIKLMFHAGAFHNFGDRQMATISDMPNGGTLTTTEFRPSDDGSHTIDLHLPFATPVTFFQAGIPAADSTE